MSDELHKEYWQACEKLKEYFLSHSEILMIIKDEYNATWMERFNVLWKESCQNIEEDWKLGKGMYKRMGFSDKRLRTMLLKRSFGVYEYVVKELMREMELTAVREAGYEAGREAGIVEVYNRDKEKREEGQRFAETPQGRMKREKAELCDAACELYYTAIKTDPISWEEAVRSAAKKLGRRITKPRSKAEQARRWYPEWCEKHVRKGDHDPKTVARARGRAK